jgi:cyclopropane-fatty-acyl-phospholipid synthase
MSLSSGVLRRGSSRLARVTAAPAGRLVTGMLERMGAPPVEVRLWDGSVVGVGGAARFRVTLRRRSALVRLLADPEFQLAECYADGSLDIEGDLIGFFECILAAGPQRATLRARLSYGFDSMVRRLLRRDDARANARHHYELPSEFYRLWLDPGMTYTCAYFEEPDQCLEDAQRAKLDLVCRKLALRPGMHVIEAGSGWGALALHMAKHYGVSVSAYNVSREQTEYGRDLAEREGLARRVTFVCADYGAIRGRCDAFASVGMLEHVPTWDYAKLGDLVRRVLAPHGRALIHTIARNRRMAPPRWTRRRIFPGGYMPSLAELSQVFEPNDLSVLDVQNLRLHYAATLEHWLRRYELAHARVIETFDERFVRAWRLYLASAAAGFRGGLMQLFQVVVAHARSNTVPRSRPESA